MRVTPHPLAEAKVRWRKVIPGGRIQRRGVRAHDLYLVLWEGAISVPPIVMSRKGPAPQEPHPILPQHSWNCREKRMRNRMTAYHKKSRDGRSVIVHEQWDLSVLGHGTHNNHDLHPHFSFRKSYKDLRAGRLQVLSSVSTRKTITPRWPWEPSFYQTSTVGQRENSTPGERSSEAEFFRKSLITSLMMSGDSP